MNSVDWRPAYLLLSPDSALRYLETPCLYHIETDELYELDPSGLSFLSRCNGARKGADLTDDATFVEYCLRENLLLALDQPDKSQVTVQTAPFPSLRYLELQLTRRCNLKCRHCYLGPQKNEDLSLADAVSVAEQFEAIGGLRLLISGGEPLRYPLLRRFLKEISALKIRRVLLTNGTLITAQNIKSLQVNEIQFSLDGWEEGHELLRGKGTFDKVINAITLARDTGIQISVATMVHQGNVNEFERMKAFIADIGAREWGIDALCMAGNLTQNTDLAVPPDQAAPLMHYGFGGGYHGPSDGFACGRHLMTVLPSGMGVKCGFYEDRIWGDARKNLKECWLNLKHLPLKDLTCRDCSVIEACAGGCRFRAPNEVSPDPYMCALYGVSRGNLSI